MRTFLLAFIVLLLVGAGFISLAQYESNRISGAPPYEVANDPPTGGELDEYAYLQNWKRPEGPAKVALQAGHWKSNEAPEELKRLRTNTGASGGGKSEWEVNYEIAELTKELLEEKGVVVEILPATVPPKYWADVFVSIHADGSENTSKSGFKAAIPRRDMSGTAGDLLSRVEEAYQLATDMELDPVVTRNMTGYYAFGWWRYDHALHPMTTAMILETGFLTNPTDRLTIVNNPELSAEGLANGIISYLTAQELLEG